MSTLTENDDTTDELIPVETPLEETDEADEADDGDDDGDARLAQSEDDSEDDIAAGNNKRQKRRERQRRAKDATKQELDYFRQRSEQLEQRLSAVESHAVGTNVQTIEGRLNKALHDAEIAKQIIAAAVEAGNGTDVTQAMEIRDSAMREAQQLAAAHQQMSAAQQQASQPRADPSVTNYAKQWLAANPWYDPQARDRDSALTKAIDNELAAEGFNPGTRAYWEELTDRVADAIGTTGKPAPGGTRRKAPPTGNTREHAPPSTRREIYVTPERKQAMEEAGVWDDPTLRQRYLKAYQAYDTGSAR
jgi:hypothetical protein